MCWYDSLLFVKMKFKINNLKYFNWSGNIFEIIKEAELLTVPRTVVCPEDFSENFKETNEWKISLEETYSKKRYYVLGLD